MIQCRMCSQPLTRRGELCPECERELHGGQTLLVGGSAADSLRAPADGFDAIGRLATTRWLPPFRSPGIVVVAAFAMAAAGAATLYLVQRASASGAPAMESLPRAEVPASETRSPAEVRSDAHLRDIEVGPAAVATGQARSGGSSVAETATGQDVTLNSPSR